FFIYRACADDVTDKVRSCGKSRNAVPGELYVAGVDHPPGAAREGRHRTYLFLDTQELIVLGETLAAGHGTYLDLSSARGHREVGDRCVLGLAAPGGDYRAIAGCLCRAHHLQRLRESADLVYLDKNAVGHAFRDSSRQAHGARDEEIVP